MVAIVGTAYEQETAVLYDKQELSEEALRGLTYHELARLQKLAGEVKRKKYNVHKYRQALYGNLPRVIPHQLIINFFNEPVLLKNKPVRNKFLLLFFYGRRIGEANSIKRVEGQALVQIINHKSRIIEYKPLIEGTEPLFSSEVNYSPDYLRKYFRDTCKRLGSNYGFQYAATSNGRKLHQFTVHCFRKTAGNILRTHTGDAYKVAVFLGHSTPSLFGATSCYMHYDVEEMRKDLNEAFKLYVETLL